MTGFRQVTRRTLPALLVGLALVAVPGLGARSSAQATHPRAQSAAKIPKGDYENPVQIKWKGHGRVSNCADPSIIYGNDKNWYAYCTSDYISNKDIRVHFLPIIRSHDLIHWRYVHDVFQSIPGWLGTQAHYLWAPDIHHFNGKYYVYYASDNSSAGGPQIGVATASKPAGPWKDSGGPVVEAHAPPCAPGCGADAKMSTLDPAVITDNGQKYIFYGSFFGGVQARKLSADGFHSDPASQTQIAIDNHYEGPFVIKHGGYFYLFLSANNCCNGALTGYTVWVGRSQNVLGPYLDQDGNSVNSSLPGGTPSIMQNGNKWVGAGHNAVFTDKAGKQWFLYHAIDRTHPYVATGPPLYPNARQLMMDPLDWVNGWPVMRGGLGPSSGPMPAPAAQPGKKDKYKTKVAVADQPGTLNTSLSDEFNSTTQSPQWSWVRQPDASTYGFDGSAFWMNTQAADLYGPQNSASLLLEPAPSGNYMIEAKMSLNLPNDGSCCYNYVQAGILAYKDDDNYIRLSKVSDWDTRTTEFLKEISPPSNSNLPFAGSSWEGPPGPDWTWLRIVKTTSGNTELYRAYTSPDGTNWYRGSVWTQNLGSSAKIGMYAMGGTGFTARFDYFHVYSLGS
jgi:arabinan endo-1,5-alpha-L-arabinosidase